MTPGPSGRPCRPATFTALDTNSIWVISLNRKPCLVLLYLDIQPCKPQLWSLLKGLFSPKSSAVQRMCQPAKPGLRVGSRTSRTSCCISRP
ncbi:rCG37194, isoform CRA_b [Rattus norvegicus]|uniref:RCG37194, isoform CRA_b n=1 Tax=Rattus norvegicus TaxID=10116 RepID=A6HTX1_RAT|nr:rCG37194, isoform CRA_b [Rattus norvegicus]